ncbi:hypothetical protein BJX96DRAFT_178762 [Aspergillus floccosus]
MLVPSSDLALIGLHPPSTCAGFKALRDAVTAKYTSLALADCEQYISLKHMSRRDFILIEAHRHGLGSAVRLTYFQDIQTRIVKVVSREHEAAHRGLGHLITRRIDRMNIPLAEFTALGSTTFTGPSSSTKEAGVAESMPRLGPDAA